jgi:hypothetical protein
MTKIPIHKIKNSRKSQKKDPWPQPHRGFGMTHILIVG